MLEAPVAGMRRKSIALCDEFIALSDARCGGVEVITTRESAVRGSHVSLRHPRSQDVMDALIARGVIGDCRPPDLLRFGFAPLYVRYIDVWDAVEALVQVV